MAPKNKPDLHADEDLHDLQLNGMWLIQKNKGFRFGMDAVLLSDFCRTTEKAVIADFGTGTGILPVLLKGKHKAQHIEAFEILPDMADLARRNIEMNGIDQTVTVRNMDCVDAAKVLKPNSLDAIVTNPPYGETGKTLVNPDPDKAIARHQSADTLEKFFRSAYQCLKGKGKIFLIYPVQGMLNIMEVLKKYHLEPKKFRIIYPYADKPANLVLIEAVKDAKPGLLSMPPLIIYEKPGVYTKEVSRIYGMTGEND